MSNNSEIVLIFFYSRTFFYLYRLRRKLTSCYEFKAANACGAAAGQVLAPLIRMHYAFEFLPPCQQTAPPTLEQRRNRTNPVRPTPPGNRFRSPGARPGGGGGGGESSKGGENSSPMVGDGADNPGGGGGYIESEGGESAGGGNFKFTGAPICACAMLTPAAPVKAEGVRTVAMAAWLRTFGVAALAAVSEFTVDVYFRF